MEPVLAIDVGSGTQDILIYDPAKEMENNIKLILPSQTQIIAKKINEATRAGKDIYLYGNVMGGGPNKRAVKDHISKGFHVYSSEKAAFTFKDDLNKVRDQGIVIADFPPEEALFIELKDVDLEKLKKALSFFGVDLPQNYAVTLQDHGFSPHESNRRFRFLHWEKFLNDGGAIPDLVYGENIPEYFSRMQAVREHLNDAVMMDAGAAAMLGALEDERVKEVCEKEGCILLNIGNQHIIAFLVKDERVYGIFEHHTGMLDPDSLYNYLQEFKRGELTNQKVFEERGHGCKVFEEARRFSWDFIAVTGPKREMAKNFGYLAVPHGDMMFSGCFGLLRGIRYLKGVK